MKVVLVNHGTAGDWGGGDSVQIKQTASKLLERGYDVSIQNSDRPRVKDADIVHIFNCRVYESFKQQVYCCQVAGVPVVVSPIWINIGKAIWGSRGTFGLLSSAMVNGEDSIGRQLESLKNKSLVVEMDNGNINSDGKGTYSLDWVRDVGEILNQTNGVIPNSWLELKAIQNDLNWDGENYQVAHYGVDPTIFMNADPNLFREETGIRGDFIMQAGRIEPGKNQAMLCWALRKTKMKIVLIGGTKHWPAYGKLCKEIGGENVTIIDHMSQELLASAYSAAKIHSLASWMDTCGLVSLEAAMSGTPLVGSTFGHELEYLQNEAQLANPGDPESIHRAVQRAWECKRNGEKQLKLKERILANYNWEKTTSNTEKMYKQIIGTA